MEAALTIAGLRVERRRCGVAYLIASHRLLRLIW
jgi:hypothetical protein